MSKEKYTIKEEEEIDISDRDASVSMSFRGEGRSGSPVLTFETDDGRKLSVVMSRDQAMELRFCVTRTRSAMQRADSNDEVYEHLAPSRFALESEIGILLSDGIGRMRTEITAEVAQRLRLPADLYTAGNPMGRRFARDVRGVLEEMVSSHELEEEAGAYRARAQRWPPRD